jgi:hypothetical protein
MEEEENYHVSHIRREFIETELIYDLFRGVEAALNKF